jgi:hypothetical protein
MRRRPRFEYGDGFFFEASLTALAWTPKDITTGGRRIASAGLPASYVVRRDAVLDVQLRFTEDEWPDLLAVIAAGQSDAVLTFYPDAEESTTFQVYLDAPASGDTFQPVRDSAFPRMLTVTLTLRGVSGTPPWVGYFADD